MEEDKQSPILHVIKSLCDFCGESTYTLVMAREAESGEPLLICEGCASTFGDYNEPH